MPLPSRLPAPVGWKPPTRGERTLRGGGQTARAGGGQTARAGGGQTARAGGGQTAWEKLAQRRNQPWRLQSNQAAHGSSTARERPPTQRTLGAARLASRQEATLRSWPSQSSYAIQEAREGDTKPNAQASAGCTRFDDALHDDAAAISVGSEPPNVRCGTQRPDAAEASLDQLGSLTSRSFMSDPQRGSRELETGCDGSISLPLAHSSASRNSCRL